MPEHQSFYEVAAQVIPVSLLLIAVSEYRLEARADAGLGWLMVFLGSLAIIAFGELAALRVLVTGRESKFLKGQTAVALTLGIVGLFLQVTALFLGDSGFLEKHPRAQAGVYSVVTIIAMGGCWMMLFVDL